MAFYRIYAFSDFAAPLPLDAEETEDVLERIQSISNFIAELLLWQKESRARHRLAPIHEKAKYRERVNRDYDTIQRMLELRHRYALRLQIGDRFPPTVH